MTSRTNPQDTLPTLQADQIIRETLEAIFEPEYVFAAAEPETPPDEPFAIYFQEGAKLRRPSSKHTNTYEFVIGIRTKDRNQAIEREEQTYWAFKHKQAQVEIERENFHNETRTHIRTLSVRIEVQT